MYRASDNAKAPLVWERRPELPPDVPPYRPHHAFVNCTAICDDGSRVVAGNYFYDYDTNASIRSHFSTFCYDGQGNLLWRHVPKQEIWGGVYWVAISGDGKYAASGGWCDEEPTHDRCGENPPHTGFVQAFRASDGKVLLEPQKTIGRCNMIGLSEDGSVLVAGAKDLHVYRLDGDRYVALDTVEMKNSAYILSLSDDGRWVIVGDFDGDCFLYEIENGKATRRADWKSPKAGKPLHSIAMTPDGQWFVVGGNDADYYLYLFNRDQLISKGTPSWRYELKVGDRRPNSEWGLIYGVAISADGRYVSCVGDGTPDDPNAGELYVLENRGDTFKLLWQHETRRAVNSTSMDSAGKYVTVADGHPNGTPGHFYLFDRASGELKWLYTTDDMSWPMFFAKNGSAIVAGSDTGQVFYFTPE